MNDNGKGPKPVTIIVNARPQVWTEKKISFEQVVALAYPGQPISEQDSVTVRYSRGHEGNGSGTLTAAKDIPVKDGMVFDVVRTSRS